MGNGGGHGLDGVIAVEEPVVAAGLGFGFEALDALEGEIERGAGLRRAGAVALEIVIEMREVGEEDVGGEILLAQEGARGVGDPGAGFP